MIIDQTKANESAPQIEIEQPSVLIKGDDQYLDEETETRDVWHTTQHTPHNEGRIAQNYRMEYVRPS